MSLLTDARWPRAIGTESVIVSEVFARKQEAKAGDTLTLRRRWGRDRSVSWRCTTTTLSIAA